MEEERTIPAEIAAAADRSPATAGVAAGGAVVLAIAAALHYGGANGLLWGAAEVLLVFVGWFDAKTRRILNVVVVPAIVAAIGLRLLFERGAVLECLAACAIAFIVFLGLAVIARGGLGMGDVKLAALIGALLGTQALYALMLGVIAGGVAAALILAAKRGSRKTSYAYGPYLALGAAVLILLGHPPHFV